MKALSILQVETFSSINYGIKNSDNSLISIGSIPFPYVDQAIVQNFYFIADGGERQLIV